MKRYTFSVPATGANGMPVKLYPAGFYKEPMEWIKWTSNRDEAITWNTPDLSPIIDEFVSPTLEVIDDEQIQQLDDAEAPSDSKRHTTLFD